ncbi:alpha/beta hydrolase [Candidatus Peribacteria bacterium]|nr:alpha/beta hydrolase [Candidatus Peribacteria bacterium]
MKSTTLLCLHGWGGDHHSFHELKIALEGSGITVLAPDLPGFGEESEPKEPWTTDDYVAWVSTYIRNNISGPYMLLGHSHGGRIAIKLLASGNTVPCPLLPTHVFLCAAAGIKHPRHLKRIFGLTLAKTGKALLRIPGLRVLQPLGKTLLYKLVRVHDYEKASPIMQQTLIHVSREDLRPLLPRIAVPTDIFWGEDDRMTPVGDAHIMHKAIAESALHIYHGVRHRVHRDRAEEIAEVIAAKA